MYPTQLKPYLAYVSVIRSKVWCEVICFRPCQNHNAVCLNLKAPHHHPSPLLWLQIGPCRNNLTGVILAVGEKYDWCYSCQRWEIFLPTLKNILANNVEKYGWHRKWPFPAHLPVVITEMGNSLIWSVRSQTFRSETNNFCCDSFNAWNFARFLIRPTFYFQSGKCRHILCVLSAFTSWHSNFVL